MAGTLPTNGELVGLLADDECQGQNKSNNQEVATPIRDLSEAAINVKSANRLTLAILPLALLAALAVATTAATSIYAYAELLCQDPTQCEGREQNKYARVVAVAALIANLSGLLVLGPLEGISRSNHTVGLALWFILRLLSVVFLATGCLFFRSRSGMESVLSFFHLDQLRNIPIALFSQAFRGFASDNLLHFQLNAIYVQHPDSGAASRLIGSSLALYMIGISVGPFMPSLFHDEVTGSFVMASAMFGVSLLYLVGYTVGVKAKPTQPINEEIIFPDNESRVWRSKTSNALRTVATKIFSPLYAFLLQPIALWPGITLLLYNTGQAFAFPIIMVHTTLRFGFTAKENGILISIAHATSAFYLFGALYLIPRIIKSSIWGYLWSHPSTTVRRPRTSDGLFAIGSLVTQSTALLFFGLARESWQVYPIICLFALGLATSSFVKSYTVLCFPIQYAPRAIAALSMVETAGGVLAPAVLGGLQTMRPRAEVLFVAAVLMGLAAWTFLVGVWFEKTRRPTLGWQ